MKLVSLKRERNVSGFKMAPFCLIRRNTKYNQTQPQQTNPKPQIFSSTPREPKTQQRLIVNVKPSARPDQIQGGGVADGQFSFSELGFISYNLSTQLCIHVMFTIWGFGFVLLWLSLEIVTWNVRCHKSDCIVLCVWRNGAVWQSYLAKISKHVSLPKCYLTAKTNQVGLLLTSNATYKHELFYNFFTKCWCGQPLISFHLNSSLILFFYLSIITYYISGL